jgi:hypothetical protein
MSEHTLSRARALIEEAEHLVFKMQSGPDIFRMQTARSLTDRAVELVDAAEHGTPEPTGFTEASIAFRVLPLRGRSPLQSS